MVVDPEAYSYFYMPGLIEITTKQDSFIFTVESTGAVKVSDDQFGELGAHMRGG